MDFNCDKCDGTQNEDNDCRQLDRGVTVDKTEYLHTRNPASTLNHQVRIAPTSSN